MRKIGVAVTALAVISISSPEVAGAQTATWGATLEANGWGFINSTSEMAWFTRAAVRPSNSPYRRLWVRQEFASPQDWGIIANSGYPLKVRSAVGLIEADCSELRSRTLQMIYYSDPNMGGTSAERVGREPAWSYGAPGTVGEAEIAIACAAGAAPSRASSTPRKR